MYKRVDFMNDGRRNESTTFKTRQKTNSSTTVGNRFDTSSRQPELSELIELIVASVVSSIEKKGERKNDDSHKSSWMEKWGVAIVSTILAGAAGYFSGIWAIKDEVNSLKVTIQQLQSNNEALRRDVDSLNNSRSSENLNARVASLEATATVRKDNK